MRRTLLSVLVAVATFAVTSVALVGGFALVAGRSTGPTQGSDNRSSAWAPVPSSPADPVATASSSPDDPEPSPSTLARPGLLPGSIDGLVVSVLPTDAPTPDAPKTGVLSQDFRTLGLDDPTTAIDESLRSACDVVGGTIAGPALCNER